MTQNCLKLGVSLPITRPARDGGMDDWKSSLRKTIQHFADQLRVIRTGTISAGLVQCVRVHCEGNQVAVGRLGAIKSHGFRILIEPFDVP